MRAGIQQARCLAPALAFLLGAGLLPAAEEAPASVRSPAPSAPPAAAGEPARIIFSTYLGGSGGDAATGIAADREFDIYICGATGSADFPTVVPYQAAKPGRAAGSVDAFAIKLASNGSAIRWSTYLGGSGGDTRPASIQADATESVYLSGSTSAPDFPTLDPFQAAYGGGAADGFAAKLASGGSALLYSTFLGGSATDGVLGAVLDQHGRLFAAGSTSSGDFPTAGEGRRARGEKAESFVAKLASAGSALVFSTALAPGRAQALTVLKDTVMVAGRIRSDARPGREAGRTGEKGGSEPFLAGLSETDGEEYFDAGLEAAGAAAGLSVDGDPEGGLYAMGACLPTEFPTRSGRWSEPGRGDVWVGKFAPATAPDSSLLFSAFLGGSGDDRGGQISYDWRRNLYVTGTTSSDDFPTRLPPQSSRAGGNDAFLARLDSSGADLLFSTYWGGSGEEESLSVWADDDACAYVCGETNSADFPTIYPLQGALEGAGDGFAAKFRPPPPPGETFIDRQYRKLSQIVSQSVYRFDSFFGEQIVEEEIDTPWIRVRGSVEIKEGFKLDFSQHFGANLPLPILERRLHTYFGSDADDDLGTDNEYHDPTDDQHFNAGLRYYLYEVANLKPSLSGGLEWKGRPVFYLKPRLEWDYSDEPWYLQAIQYVYWYSDDGPGETTRFITNRLFGRHWLARGETEATYSNTSSGVDLSQEFDLRYLDFRLSGIDHFAAAIEWVSNAHTWHCFRADSHTLTLRLRHTVWREWLRLEVAPRLTWKMIYPDEGEDHWQDAAPSVFLIAEILFEEVK